MGKTAAVELPRVVRWGLLLCAGMIFGLGVGFALALTKPRVSGGPSSAGSTRAGGWDGHSRSGPATMET